MSGVTVDEKDKGATSRNVNFINRKNQNQSEAEKVKQLKRKK